jgi:micrococcal nuclease
MLLLMTFVCFGTTTRVSRVIDGDTFETETGEKVRLVGINAPEISDIFGEESKRHLLDLIENKIVSMLPDELSNDRDRYQRLLRYVIIDGIDINNKMISDGYAFAYLKFKFSNFKVYKQAQITARETNKGIWGDNVNSNEVENKEIKLWKVFTPKIKFLTFLIFILLGLGLFYYIKK